MPDKLIQVKFGEALMDAVSIFAKADIPTVSALEASNFCHVSDAALRKVLAETLYGARWMYKLGLALLVKDEEQLAHVRSQIIDYGAVCEGLLHSMVRHGLLNGIMRGSKYKYNDTARLLHSIQWWPSSIDTELSKRSFHWLIVVSEEEAIIDKALAVQLHRLRRARNTVHMQARTHKAFLGTSKAVYRVMNETIELTKAWKKKHP